MAAIATFDQDVIDEWGRRLAQRRRSSRRALAIFVPVMLIAVLPPILGLARPLHYLAYTGLVVAFVAIVCAFMFRTELACPHCGKNPVLGNQLVPLWQIDHCAKCSYWLLDPRRSSSGPA